MPKLFLFIVVFYSLLNILSLVNLSEFSVIGFFPLALSLITIIGLAKGYRLALQYFRLINHMMVFILIVGAIAIWFPNDILFFSGNLFLKIDNLEFIANKNVALGVFTMVTIIHTAILYRGVTSDYCKKSIISDNSNVVSQSIKRFTLSNSVPISIYFTVFVLVFIYSKALSPYILNAVNEALLTGQRMTNDILYLHYNGTPTQFDNAAEAVVNINEKMLIIMQGSDNDGSFSSDIDVQKNRLNSIRININESQSLAQ